MGKIYTGCSGFSYRDWKGTFYPSGISTSEMLEYYSKFFNVVEINYSFYSMPHRYTFLEFLNRTKRMKFAVKVNKIFTHERNYTKEDAKKFIYAVEPLLESDRFIALLFQFPQGFHYCKENLDYLKKLSFDFSGIDKVIEVRSRSFARHDFYNFVEEMGFSLVNIDAPVIKGAFVGPWLSVGYVNYVRLHGRRKDLWFSAEERHERYDYLYTQEELEYIKRKVDNLDKKCDTYIFFNNHYRGKAVYNALQFKRLLGENVNIPKGLASSFSYSLWE